MFSSLFTLRRHVDTYHLRVKRFQCEKCPKSFAYRHTLRGHMKHHSAEDKSCVHSKGMRLEITIPKLTTLLKSLSAPRTSQYSAPHVSFYLPEIVPKTSECTLVNIFL